MKMNDLISRQEAIETLKEKVFHDLTDEFYEVAKVIAHLPPKTFDLTVQIDAAYDDGYTAGYLQGMHDWRGDIDERTDQPSGGD